MIAIQPHQIRLNPTESNRCKSKASKWQIARKHRQIAYFPSGHRKLSMKIHPNSVAELKLMLGALVHPKRVALTNTVPRIMKDHTYKLIELVGTSSIGIEDAVNNALQRAGQTVKNMRWFEVMETRGQIENNKVAHWQITLKIGFTIEDPHNL
jgi:flavin-binding protein dodecin